MRRRGTDTMPIYRYDLADPQNLDVFLPKLWRCSSIYVDDSDDSDDSGVLLRCAEIISLTRRCQRCR